MRKTYRVKLSELVSDYNKDYAIANLSHSFTGYDPQFTEGNGFLTFAVNTDEHLTNQIIREKLSSSSFVSAVSSGDYKKRVVKVPQLKEAGQGKWLNEQSIWRPNEFKGTPAKDPMTDKQHSYLTGLFARKDYSAHPYAGTFAFHEKNIQENRSVYSKYHASQLIDNLKEFPDKIKEAHVDNTLPADDEDNPTWSNGEKATWSVVKTPGYYKMTLDPPNLVGPGMDSKEHGGLAAPKRWEEGCRCQPCRDAHVQYFDSVIDHINKNPNFYIGRGVGENKIKNNEDLNNLLTHAHNMKKYYQSDGIRESSTESTYPDFAHGMGINGSPLTDTASNNPFTTEQGKSGVDAGLEIPDTENAQYLIGQDDIRNPGGGRYSEPQKIVASSWVTAERILPEIPQPIDPMERHIKIEHRVENPLQDMIEWQELEKHIKNLHDLHDWYHNKEYYGEETGPHHPGNTDEGEPLTIPHKHAKKEEEEKKVDKDGLPIPDEEDGLPKGRTLADLWGGIGGMGTSNDKSGNS